MNSYHIHHIHLSFLKMYIIAVQSLYPYSSEFVIGTGLSHIDRNSS